MDLTGKKNSDVLVMITEKLNEKYEKKTFGGRQCYVNKNAVPFKLFCLQNDQAFGLEYADSTDEAEQGRFEDGDIFYLSDYTTLEEMLTAMCKEIDDTKG